MTISWGSNCDCDISGDRVGGVTGVKIIIEMDVNARIASLNLFGTIQHFKWKLLFLVFAVDLIENFIIKSHKKYSSKYS